MKISKKVWLVLGLVLLLAAGFFYGCGQSGGSGSSRTVFYSNVSNSAPVFKPASTSAQAARSFLVTAKATSEWGSGNPLYSVYFSLREFLSSRDEGKVDRSNIYKLLTDIDTVFSGLSPEAVAITEQAITPPFSGLPVVTCDRAKNDTTNKKGIALKETDSRIDAILGWIWSDSPLKNEYGVACVSYDKLTKDVTAEMTYSVDYNISSTETDYNLRGNVSGNPDQHSFQFRYIIGDTKIVAKGVSRGAGNYMLIKYTDLGSGVKYVVVPGDADENYFIAQNTSQTNIYDNPASLPSSVEAYKSWVENTAFLATSDLMTDSNTFNSGNSKQGTIYINYQ